MHVERERKRGGGHRALTRTTHARVTVKRVKESREGLGVRVGESFSLSVCLLNYACVCPCVCLAMHVRASSGYLLCDPRVTVRKCLIMRPKTDPPI